MLRPSRRIRATYRWMLLSKFTPRTPAELSVFALRCVRVDYEYLVVGVFTDEDVAVGVDGNASDLEVLLHRDGGLVDGAGCQLDDAVSVADVQVTGAVRSDVTEGGPVR
jgi:hypothetical protein